MPGDPQLEVEILRQKITQIREFSKKIENEKHIIGFKYNVREKEIRKWISIFDIINTSCNFKQNLSKGVIMDINGLKF